MSVTQQQCGICAEDFKGRGGKKMVVCDGCDNGVCVECCKTYMLDETRPKCMYPDCGMDWSRQFLASNFPISFLSGPLKKKREEVFFDQETALLPATQEAVNESVRKDKIRDITAEYKKKRVPIHNTFRTETRRINGLGAEDNGYILQAKTAETSQLDNIVSTHTFDGIELPEDIAPLHIYGEEKGRTLESLVVNPDEVREKLQLAFGNQGIFQHTQQHNMAKGLPMSDFFILVALTVSGGGRLFVPDTFAHWDFLKRLHRHKNGVVGRDLVANTNAKEAALRAAGVYTTREGGSAKNERRFIRACPKEECKGYLSTGWKCGLCEEHVCSKCHIPIGLKGDADHECDPDVAATAQLIATESKPCPGCAVNIYKISGCNQMWCTQCKTPWDWRSGRVERQIHNPHYFEYLRMHGRAAAAPDAAPIARNPNEVRCGREIDVPFAAETGTALARWAFPEKEHNRVMDTIRGLIHFDIHHINRRLGDNPDTESLRIRYMRNMIDEKQFKRLVQMRHKKFHKEAEIRDVFVMFKQTVTDILYRFRDAIDTAHSPDSALAHMDILDEVTHLETYVNSCLKNIAVAYQLQAHEICLIRKFIASGKQVMGMYNPKARLYEWEKERLAEREQLAERVARLGERVEKLAEREPVAERVPQ
jgi:hypothetical protein